MISTIILFAIQLTVVTAVTPLDGNCTVSGKYIAAAFACDNSVDDAVCDVFYKPPTNAADKPAVDNDKERPVACFDTAQTPTTIVDNMKTASIKLCPKTCGYCCLTPEYNCKDAAAPKFIPDCTKVTKAMCSDVQWRELIAQDCPSACGFCLEGGCVDAAVECASVPGICLNINMQAFVQAKCKKTCNLCTGTGVTFPPGYTTPAGGITGLPNNCIDASRNCASWVRNGYCTNSFYTNADRMRNCAKSCNLCQVGK